MQMWALLMAIVLGGLFTSCQKDNIDNIIPEEDNYTANNATSEITDRAAPYVSSITSNDGTGLSIPSTYVQYTNIDYDGGTILYVGGTSFGSTQGSSTITLNNSPNYAITQIVSWTTNKITIKVKATVTGAQAITNASISVKVNGVQGTRPFLIVPRVYSRQFKQCTWWASLRRIDSGKSPQARGNSYSQFTGVMDAYYIPQAKDLLAWYKPNTTTGHQAFLESVSTSSAIPSGQPSGTIDYTYTMNISQYNIIPESYSSYSRVVKVRKYPNGSRSIISGNFGNPSLGSSYSSWKYFR